MEQLGSHWTDFHKILYFSIFRKFVEGIQVSLKSDKNNSGTLHVDQYILFIISRSVLLRMRNVSDKSCRENQNPHFAFINFFFENPVVYEIMWTKYCRAGQATDNNMAHTLCILDN